MFVSTRCLFPSFAITWLLGSDKTKAPTTRLFPDLSPELIKEYNVEDGVENSISCFLLEAEGKRAIFDTGFNEAISTGIPDRLKELKISPNEIDYVFITHFHRDHIGGLIDKNDQISFQVGMTALLRINKNMKDEKKKSFKNALMVFAPDIKGISQCPPYGTVPRSSLCRGHEGRSSISAG